MKEISVWKIAAGIAMGILGAWLVQVYLAKLAVEEGLRQIEEAARQSTAELNAKQAERQRLQQAAITRKAQVEAELNRLQIERQNERISLANDREAAWKAFYTKPKKCDDPNTPELFTQCANEHIRAKRKFEETYQP